ncbi:effector-associated domain EAD1-containing protein [Sorangium sp. So ce1153]|uniref:effector-associated domain EAD1-containing protein n=1 Tax=Sorangium sp. So ce1153 TaxID=3133333 RepID=UPI003F5E67F8
MSSKVDRSMIKDLHEALLAAYPTYSELERMVRVELGENLHTIAANSNLKDVVFELLKWAETRDLIGDLLGVVRAANEDAAARASVAARIPETLRPGLYARSPRLDRTVAAVLVALDEGHRIVALYGRPGDGKTQVGQQLAARREGDVYFALPRVDEHGNDDVWRDGLRSLASELLGPSSDAQDAAAAAARIRKALARRGDVRLILDNADRPSPIDVGSLLPAGTPATCVLIGAYDQGVARSVQLPQPTDDEFRDIFRQSAGPDVSLSSEQSRVLADIGAAVSNSAIVALCIGQGCSSAHLSEDLGTYRRLLSEAGLSDEERIQRVIDKCWASLGREERERVAFVAAFGEAEIPRSWIPERLAAGSPRRWKLLDAAGVIERVHDRVRIHRLIARHAESQCDVDVTADLTAVLEAWTDDLDVLDELKLDGIRAHAFLHAVRALVRRGSLRGTPAAVAAIEKTYIDLAPIRGDQSALEKRVRLLVPESRDVATLHPAVLGQIVDTLGKVAHPDLARLRGQALAELRRRVAAHPLPETMADERAWLDASAVHHLGKHLQKNGASDAERREGAALLKDVDRYAALVPRTSPYAARWRVRAATARLQLAMEKIVPTEEAATLLLEIVDDPQFERPRYLRTKIIERLLRLGRVPQAILPEARRGELLAQGLGLCKSVANPTTQAEFLQFAGTEIGRMREPAICELLLRAADAVLARLDPATRDYKRAAASIAHAFHKAAELRADTRAVEELSRALELYARADVGRFVGNRAAAVLRDLGLPDEALAILDVIIEALPITGDDTYWIGLERAKALRWAGRGSEAESVVNLLLSEHPRYVTSLTDERAKELCTTGRWQDAAALLTDNALRYEQEGQTMFAERCRRWLANREEEQRGPGGLLEDEWLCERRRSTLSVVERSSVDTVARQHADSILRSLRSKTA